MKYDMVACTRGIEENDSRLKTSFVYDHFILSSSIQRINVSIECILYDSDDTKHALSTIKVGRRGRERLYVLRGAQ